MISDKTHRILYKDEAWSSICISAQIAAHRNVKKMAISVIFHLVHPSAKEKKKHPLHKVVLEWQ